MVCSARQLVYIDFRLHSRCVAQPKGADPEFFFQGGPTGETSDLKIQWAKKKKEEGQRGEGEFMVKLVTIFMLIALYFFNYNIVSEHWGRFEVSVPRDRTFPLVPNVLIMWLLTYNSTQTHIWKTNLIGILLMCRAWRSWRGVGVEFREFFPRLVATACNSNMEHLLQFKRGMERTGVLQVKRI